MKARELMIYSCVYDKEKNPRKISAIRTGEIEFLDGGLPQAIGSIAPIPLTPEILKKNGFVLESEDDWFIIETSSSYFIIEFCRDLETDEIENDSFMVFQRIECKYVHILQQVLRLCGMNELADGFKV